MSAHTDQLVGKTIVGIDVSQDEEALRFRFVDGDHDPIVWVVGGECCSHSYWHDGYSLNALRGATVMAVATLDLPEADGEGDDVSTQCYGYAITTNKGAATLAFRNDSNGYYGGSCGLGRDSDRFRWREITANDWQQGGANDPPVYTPEELAEKAAEAKRQEFRNQVSRGLDDCRKQLRQVFTSAPMWSDSGPAIDTVLALQDKPTFDILVLGVYLTRMAEETLKANAGRPVTDNPQV